jgi:hypothetical protein
MQYYLAKHEQCGGLSYQVGDRPELIQTALVVTVSYDLFGTHWALEPVVWTLGVREETIRSVRFYVFCVHFRSILYLESVTKMRLPSQVNHDPV